MVDDIIARLEKATGPDLDLDHAIAAVINPEDGHGVLLYTASVDAALTLIPPEWSWLVRSHDGTGNDKGEGLGATHFANVFWEYYGRPIYSAYAKNAAIAICLSFFRAYKARP